MAEMYIGKALTSAAEGEIVVIEVPANSAVTKSVVEHEGCIAVCEYRPHEFKRYFWHIRKDGDGVLDPEAAFIVADEDLRDAHLADHMKMEWGRRVDYDHKLWAGKIDDPYSGDFDEDLERARLRPL